MGRDFSDLIQFVLIAPWFILGGFAGAFLITFTTIKLAQSDAVYGWLTEKMDEGRAKRAARMRRSVMRDATKFRAGRKVKEMSAIEKRHYFKTLESGYEEIERLFRPKGGRHE